MKQDCSQSNQNLVKLKKGWTLLLSEMAKRSKIMAWAQKTIDASLVLWWLISQWWTSVHLFLIFTFSSKIKTSHSLVSQHSFKQASDEMTSSSVRNFAPIAFDSSVRIIVDEWISNRSTMWQFGPKTENSIKIAAALNKFLFKYLHKYQHPIFLLHYGYHHDRQLSHNY